MAVLLPLGLTIAAAAFYAVLASSLLFRFLAGGRVRDESEAVPVRQAVPLRARASRRG